MPSFKPGITDLLPYLKCNSSTLWTNAPLSKNKSYLTLAIKCLRVSWILL
eukprot:09698.XXX_122701_122850_1 [CDS] Oithona nana genome sequencing.